MFLGSAKYSIDAKGRVSIPSRMRKNVNPEADGAFVMTRGIEKCIEVHPKDQWQKSVETKLNMLNTFNKKNVAFMRMYLEKAAEDKFDSQSRLLIPQNLIDHAGIKKDVLIIGMNKHIELWDPEEYEKYITSQDSSFEELASEVMNE